MIQLDPQQKAAVETRAEKALVVAGPGSGKTRVITERCAHLIENYQVSPFEILCITFTRKGAQEMQERLVARLGNQAYKITIKTLHAFALHMINRHSELVGLRAPITVYSDFEEQYLLKEVAKEIGLHTGKAWKKVKKKEVDQYFSWFYQASGKGPGQTWDERIIELQVAFQARCQENNALTYGMLLKELNKYAFLDQTQRYMSFKHILVDEAQDNDDLQWDIVLNMISRLKASLFCVGDIDQCIFEWRGAIPGAMIALPHVDDFHVFTLETNYRSGHDIVQACNTLIQHNARRLDKTMQATRPDVGRYVMTNKDSACLADHLCILKDNECDLSSIAVLARNHVLLQKLSQELELREIPYQYLGRKSKLKDTELFRRFHAFLKLLVNPYDNFSFLLIKDLIGVSDEDYQAIRAQAAELGESHFTVWKNRTVNSFTDFFNFKSNHDSLAVATFSLQYMATGAHPYPSWGWSIEEVNEITQFIFSYLNQNPEAHILSYLNWLATYDVQDEIEDQEAITLATIHGAKGLEWPVVYVYGLNEGLLPSKQAITSGDIEAERRLAYVGMSRAENLLHLVVRPEQSEGKDGKVYENPVSRFIHEIEPETVEV
ncbi:MAG: ATP-dependent helicase [Desulfovermiculus sp.]